MYNTRNELWQKSEDHIISQTVCGHTYNDTEREREADIKRYTSFTRRYLICLLIPEANVRHASLNEIFSFSQA